MGWASGSGLLGEIIDAISDCSFQFYSERVECYRKIILAFEDVDCDTIDECVPSNDGAFDEAWQQLRKERGYYEDDEE